MDKDFMLNYYDKMVRPIWTELMKTPRYQRVACEHDKLEREFWGRKRRVSRTL